MLSFNSYIIKTNFNVGLCSEIKSPQRRHTTIIGEAVQTMTTTVGTKHAANAPRKTCLKRRYVNGPSIPQKTNFPRAKDAYDYNSGDEFGLEGEASILFMTVCVHNTQNKCFVSVT